MKTKHILNTGKRIVTLEEDKQPLWIEITVTYSKVGDLGDIDKIRAWLQPLLQRDDDLRPVIMKNPLTGEGVIVSGDANEVKLTPFNIKGRS